MDEDEQEKQNQNKLKNTLKNEVKNEVKNKSKAIMKKALKAIGKAIAAVVKALIQAIWPILLIVILSLFIIEAIKGAAAAIKKAVDRISSDDSSYTADDDKINGSKTAKDEANEILKLSEDGKSYEINQDVIDRIMVELNEEDYNIEELGLANDVTVDENNNVTYGSPQEDDMIVKYLKAGASTMFPKIESSDIDGIINVKRNSGDGEIDLTYMPYSEFKEKVDNKDESTVNYFSLNPDNMNLCYSTVNIIEVTNSDGTTYRESIVSMVEQEYQSIVEPYAMPVYFLVSTHVLADDNDFMQEILNLQKNGYIDLVIRDSKSINSITYDYSGKVTNETIGTAKYTYTGNYPSIPGVSHEEANSQTGTVTTTKTVDTDIDNSNIGKFNTNMGIDVQPIKTVAENMSTELMVTNIDTWIAKRVYKYDTDTENTKQDPQVNTYKSDGSKEIEKRIIPPSNVPKNVTKAIEKKGISDYTITDYEQVTNQTYEVTETMNESNTTTNYTVTKTEVSMDDNVNRIINLFKYGNPDGKDAGMSEKKAIKNNKYSEAANNIFGQDDLYFEMLDKDENLQKVEDVMKYIFYKLTGDDSYGVTELDTSLFDVATYNRIEGYIGNTIEDKIWWMLKGLGYSDYAAAGAMGNFSAESDGGRIINPNAVENGGTGIGLAQWSFGRHDNLVKYAESQGKTWQDEDVQLEFLKAELTGGGLNGLAKDQLLGKASLKNQFFNASSVSNATEAFEKLFERAGVPRMDVRISGANLFYNRYHGVEKPVTSTEGGSAIIAEAKKYVGNPYVYGGDSLTNGIDCSHFVWRILQKTGMIEGTKGYLSTGNMAGSIEKQYHCKYIGTNLNDAIAGDIILYSGHTAFYDGQGKIVEAQGKKWGITDNRKADNATILGIYRPLGINNVQ